MQKITIYTFLLFVAAQVHAQVKPDSIPGRTVIKVKSTFKPEIRNTAKEIFYATSPQVDTFRPTLNYVVPAQNLFFSYQPVPLKPLAMNINNTTTWDNNNYVKIGFGNYTTPYVSAGLSFGDGRTTALGVFADFIRSKGKIKYQDYSKLGLSAQGSVSTPKGFEFKSKLSYQLDDYNFYGYDHALYNFAKKDVDQKYSTIALSAGLRNTVPTEYGLNYNPTFDIGLFGDNRKANETNIVINAPLSKNIGKNLSFKLGAKADFTFHKNPSFDTTNHIYYVMPAVQYKSAKLTINAGITPAFENKTTHILPDITADFQIKQGKKYVAQAGYLGYFNKGTYQRWAGTNPFISRPSTLFNTKVNEGFVGFKGTTGSHFVYSAKVAYLQYKNMPLYLNDTGSGKSFRVVKEDQLDVVQVHGEFGIIEKEVFHLVTGVSVNTFVAQKKETNPWGLLPLDINASLRWQFAKDFWLRVDGFLWQGGIFKDAASNKTRLPFVADLNASVEFRVAKQFNVWFNANNLINNKYQRWRNFESYGINVLGGVKYTFTSQKKALFNVVKK